MRLSVRTLLGLLAILALALGWVRWLAGPGAFVVGPAVRVPGPGASGRFAAAVGLAVVVPAAVGLVALAALRGEARRRVVALAGAAHAALLALTCATPPLLLGVLRLARPGALPPHRRHLLGLVVPCLALALVYAVAAGLALAWARARPADPARSPGGCRAGEDDPFDSLAPGRPRPPLDAATKRSEDGAGR